MSESYYDFNRNGCMDPYEDPSLSPDVRAEDLLDRMTLEEKVAQILHPWTKPDSKIIEEHGAHGIGFLYTFWVKDREAIQRHMVEKTRLGIPVAFVQEGLHSGAKGGTVFPVPLATASAFDTDLNRRIHQEIARDARYVDAAITYSPNIDVHTDPRFGRIEEGYGEDPFLTSEMGAAAVEGLQGKRRSGLQQGIAATVKHFAAYGKTENGQDGSAADLSQRTLMEVYARPFKAAVDAGAMAVMPAHNEINGVPCHGNRALLTDLLRDEWAFDGLVISDYSDTEGLCKYNVAETTEDAASICLRSGVDVDMGAKAFPELVQMVRDGRIDVALVDQAVRRVLILKFEMGLFDDPFNYQSRDHQLDSEQSRALALEAAVKSAVLLKNEGSLLPLDRGIKRVAVIGPNADHERNQLGGYTQYGSEVVTVLRGIEASAPDGVLVDYAEGCEIMTDDESLLQDAVDLASRSDVAVLVVGDAKETCQESYGGVTGDRVSLELPGGQIKLVREVAKVQKNVVLLLMCGRPVSLSGLEDQVGSIMVVWRNGSEGGNAIGRLLFGQAYPSGKLPVTFPRSVGQIPAYYYKKVRQYDGRKYTFEDSSPLYPFGYGLGYTSFSCSDLSLSSPDSDRYIDGVLRVDEEATVVVRATVSNTGESPGAEVLQVYSFDPLASVTRPLRQLVGFTRVTLDKGESATVEVEIPLQRLEFYDADMRLGVEPGEYRFLVGFDSRCELEASILVGQDTLGRRTGVKRDEYIPTPETG